MSTSVADKVQIDQAQRKAVNTNNSNYSGIIAAMNRASTDYQYFC